MTKHRLIQIFVAISAIAVIVVLALTWRSWRMSHRQVGGFTFTRVDDDVIQVEVEGKSFDITNESNFHDSLGLDLMCGYGTTLPVLSKSEGIWMWDLGPGCVAGDIGLMRFINPRNKNSLDQMSEILKVGLLDDRCTRIAARNYIYLGFAVSNQSDVDALKTALTDRKNVNLNRDIVTPNGVLKRLINAGPLLFLDDEIDPAESTRLWSSTPVLFELIDRKAGNPCDTMDVLYLDGHFERIKIGDKFPATQEFIDSFPRPAKYAPKSGRLPFSNGTSTLPAR